MASSSVPAASASAAADLPSGVLPVGLVAPSDVDVEMSGSDSEWIQIKEEQETTPFLAEAQLIDSDDKPLSEKLKELEEALAKLSVDKEKKKLAFDDEAEIVEISPRKSVKTVVVDTSTTGAIGPEGEVGAAASSSMEVEPTETPTTGAIGPEEGGNQEVKLMDTTADVIDPSAPIQFEMKEPGRYAIKGFRRACRMWMRPRRSWPGASPMMTQ